MKKYPSRASLSDVLKPVALTGRLREEVEELTGTLKDNLGRVVQNGKRADSIVKNMLLHSREGSGEHRPADINALADESLNLAYISRRPRRKARHQHLAAARLRPRSRNGGRRSQEITRVLLNLISNGFCAATKRASGVALPRGPSTSTVTERLSVRR